MDDSFQDDTPRGVPRIIDVARTAGVSTATVSRALSNPDLVSAKTRDIVQAAVAESGYRINLAARNLRRRETGGIIVLVPYIANPFFSLILAGIARVASRAGINVLVVDTQEPKGANLQIVDYLDGNRSDGLIVLDGTLSPDIFSGPRRPPAIFACEWVDGEGHVAVTVDNRRGAEIAVEHLIGLGHRKIGYLSGPPDNVLTRQRTAGALAALAAADLRHEPSWFIAGDFALASGVECARRWLALDERPTAVFSSSDAMAFGFMSELNRHGIRVPEDVSVVGFDDIDISAHFIPPLTTISQPRTEIGETAAQLLLEMIRPAGDARPPASVILPSKLVVRGSTAAHRPL